MATEKRSINVLGINDEIGSILMALKQLDVNVGTFYTIGVNNTCLDVIKGNFPSTNIIKVTEDTKDFKADLIMAKNIFGGSSQSNEDDDEEGSSESQLALLKHYIDLFSEGRVKSFGFLKSECYPMQTKSLSRERLELHLVRLTHHSSPLRTRSVCIGQTSEKKKSTSSGRRKPISLCLRISAYRSGSWCVIRR